MLCKGEHRRRKKDGGTEGYFLNIPSGVEDWRGRGGRGEGGGEEITLKKFRLIFIRYIWREE